MPRIAVVIPFYQRRAGILRRALDTIAAQRLGPDDALDILVVDDESPVPAEPETQGLDLGPRHLLRILRRPNGGPGEARNTALDALSPATDHVAFLDSDDLWEPHHLSTAIAALRAGNQLFFADHEYDGGSYFSILDEGWPAPAIAAGTPVPGEAGTYSLPAPVMMAQMIRQYVAHTSTVVFEARHAPALRFDRDLRHAGEDRFFFLGLAATADRIAFSTRSSARRGDGVNMFESQGDWNQPGRINRCLSQLAFSLKVRATYPLDPASARVVEQRIHRLRCSIAFLLLRNAARHTRHNASIARRIARIDHGFWPSLPRTTASLVRQRLSGSLNIL